MEKVIFNNYVIYDDSTIVSLKLNKAISTHENKGYKRVALYIGGKEKKIFLLHKLMAMSFIDDYEESDRISFIDYNRSNCCLSNLKISKNNDKEYKIGQRDEIYNRYLIDSNGYIFDNKKNRIVTAVLNKKNNGYPRVTLINNENKPRCQSLPVLIAKTFIKDYDETYDSIELKNGIKTDCSLSNIIIKKNGCIKSAPTEEMNIFFENQKPYNIVKYYISFLYSRNKVHFLSWSFNDDDLKQFLIEYLWKKTPHYFKIGKYKSNSYSSYAFTIFENLLKNKCFWKHIKSFQSQISIDNTFDTENIFGSIIPIIEYINEDNMKDKQSRINKKIVIYSDNRKQG